MQYLWVYLLIINVVTLYIYGIDKFKAKRNAWRIKESTLLAMAVLGGSVGALLGIQIFRHKTQKLKFKIGVPVIFLIQILACYYIWRS